MARHPGGRGEREGANWRESQSEREEREKNHTGPRHAVIWFSASWEVILTDDGTGLLSRWVRFLPFYGRQQPHPRFPDRRLWLLPFSGGWQPHLCFPSRQQQVLHPLADSNRSSPLGRRQPSASRQMATTPPSTLANAPAPPPPLRCDPPTVTRALRKHVPSPYQVSAPV